MQTFETILLKLAEFPLVKLGLTAGLAFASFLVGDVYQDAVLAVMMLMVFDTITGLAASKMEKNVISSKRFVNKVRQSAMYLIAISSANFVDITIPGQFIQFGTIAFVGGTEFISIIENIGRMGYKTPKKLLNHLKSEYESKRTN